MLSFLGDSQENLTLKASIPKVCCDAHPGRGDGNLLIPSPPVHRRKRGAHPLAQDASQKGVLGRKTYVPANSLTESLRWPTRSVSIPTHHRA